MARPACLTCWFWVAKSLTVKSGERLGQCRAHAPAIVPRPIDGKLRSLWPMVVETDFCGDHCTEGTADGEA